MYSFLSKIKYKKLKMKKGFTLIEMVVSVALFTVVVVVSTGALMTIIDANRKARSLQTVMDNLNFAMESMSRNLRTGYSYECGGTSGNCPNGKDSIVFTDQNGDSVEYEFSESSDLGSITISKNGAMAKSITSPEVDIDSLLFYVTGLDVGDNRQPLLTISISGTAGSDESTKTTFSIQTTISQRKVDS